MWVLGSLFLFALYIILVVWYLPLRDQGRLKQPYYWDQSWYHTTIILICVALLALSTWLFSGTSPWLVPVPLCTIFIAIERQRRKRGRQIAEIVRGAVAIEISELQSGVSRDKINSRIFEHYLHRQPPENWSLAHDDLRTLLKCQVLPELGLYQVESDLAFINKPGAVSPGQKIDALINAYEEAGLRLAEQASKIATGSRK